MDSRDFGYSMKNIPLASKESYVESGVFIVPLIVMVI